MLVCLFLLLPIIYWMLIHFYVLTFSYWMTWKANCTLTSKQLNVLVALLSSYPCLSFLSFFINKTLNFVLPFQLCNKYWDFLDLERMKKKFTVIFLVNILRKVVSKQTFVCFLDHDADAKELDRFCYFTQIVSWTTSFFLHPVLYG